MDRIQVSQIKKRAAQILREKNPDYRKIVLAHAAVSVAFLLFTSLIGFFLNRAMQDNQGLSGMGTTAILRTAQSVLTLAGNVLLPFWEIGLLYVAIRAARGDSTKFPQLTQGFRRAGAVIRYFILCFLMLMAVAIVCSNAIMILASLFPVPPAIESALGTIDPATYGEDPQAMMETMLQALSLVPKNQLLLYFLPIGIFYVLGYITVILLLIYRFKMSRHLLMDEEPMRVRKALRTSSQMTKGEKTNLLLLDLSFWWYFLLQIAIATIVYIPDILKALGVTLPVEQNVASLLAYVAYCVCSLMLTWFAGAYYQTAIACAYETLKFPAEDEPQII